MNCRRAGDLFSPYLEGELAPSGAAALEAHLAGCDRCRAELAALRRAVAVLQTPPPLVQPVGMLAEFKSRLETAPRRPFPLFRPPAFWLAPAGAAAALLVAVAFYLARGSAFGPAARHAGSAPAAGPRMAYAPPAPTTRELLRDEKAGVPRALPPEKREDAASRADQEKETSSARPEQGLALKAPDGTRVSGGSNAMSTPVTTPAPSRVSRPLPAGELPGGPTSIVGRTAGRRPGSVQQTRDSLFASGDRSAQRGNVALNSSPTLSPPALRPPSNERERRAHAPLQAARPPYLLPPGVPRPDAPPSPPARAKARPSAAPAAPSGGAAGPMVAAAPPPPAFGAARSQDLGTPGTGRAWVAVRFVAPAEAPGLAGQPPNDAGQDLHAAVAPQAAGEADSTPGARRMAKTARSRPASPVVTPALIEAMRRPVRVSVADVSLADLLRQISASAGVAIALDSQVPDTMRCHAELPDVPLYEALEKVADATRLIIALQVNGASFRPRAGAVPNARSPYWSREWGAAPEARFAPRESEPQKRR